MAALMMQGAANSVGNLANASRGQRSIPANNVPLISAMMQRKNFLNAKEQIGADQTLPEDKRQSLISMMGIAPDAATEQYAKYKFPEAKSGLQVVGGSLIDTSDPNNIRELFRSQTAKAEAPIIKDFIEGGEQVQKQYDPDTGQWTVVGRGPRWAPKTGGGGLDFTIFDEKGNPVVQVGGKGQNAAGVDKINARNMQKDIVGMDDQLAQFDQLEKTYKDKYLTWDYKLSNAFNSAREKAQGLPVIGLLAGELSDEQKKELADFTEFKQNASTMTNAYIKEITGAQMSEPESKRLMQDLANVNEDSPTEFWSKYKNARNKIELARKRYAYTLKNGIPYNAISLDDFKAILEKNPSAGRVETDSGGGGDVELTPEDEELLQKWVTEGAS